MDCLNILRGMFIFIIFTCKKNIFGELILKKKQFYNCTMKSLFLEKLRKLVKAPARNRHYGGGSVSETQKFELTQIEHQQTY